MILPKFNLLLLFCFYVVNVSAGDFHKHKQTINSEAERLKSLNDTFMALTKEKENSKDQDRVSKILAEMVAIEKEEKKIKKVLVEERNHLRFQHPEKDEDITQLFRIFKTLSFRDRETKSGIEGKLSQLVSLVKKVYNIKSQEPEKEQPKYEIYNKEKKKRFRRIEVVE